MHFLSPLQLEYWKRFAARFSTVEDASTRLFPEVMKIGATAQDADRGAMLIANRIKTATSALPWEYETTGLPYVGMLSLVANGGDEPVCIVETIWTSPVAFEDIDEDFALAYGEWDRTLKTWVKACRAYYSRLAAARREVFDRRTVLICERFRVVSGCS